MRIEAYDTLRYKTLRSGRDCGKLQNPCPAHRGRHYSEPYNGYLGTMFKRTWKCVCVCVRERERDRDRERERERKRKKRG